MLVYIMYLKNIIIIYFQKHICIEYNLLIYNL